MLSYNFIVKLQSFKGVDNMDIGNKIKQLRQKAGFTQENLANKVGVSAQSVSKWENSVSMPDITLLPILAEQFGVSIDELFDLTVEEKIRRIENRLDNGEELTADLFKEYENFLLQELGKKNNPYSLNYLIALLYHHRMESDAKRVQKYAKEAITLCPEKKDCQWLLNMAWGQRPWDWNYSNHAQIIDFYKDVIEKDKGEPKTSLPYYYLIDNLLADNRTQEAERYLNEFAKLPSHNEILVPIYNAHIALQEHNAEKAEKIIEDGFATFGEDSGYLFEVAQYYAGRTWYEKAIEFYEKSWELAAQNKLAEKNQPRFTDALEGIAIIYNILGDKVKAAETYDRIVKCLKEEWHFDDDDLIVIDVKARKSKLLEN